MMNLTAFAPDTFKEHLKDIDKEVKFNRARLSFDLGIGDVHRHYVLTGNEGVGKRDAVEEIYGRMADIYGIERTVTCDALDMYDSTVGFENSMKDECVSRTLLHIRNAEQLRMKNNTNHRSGLDELCDKMPLMTNSVVILSGRRGPLLELINGHEKAKELFTHIFHFEDLTPDAMFQCMTELANSRNYIFSPSAETALRKYLGFTYKQRGSNFRNTCFLQEIFDLEILGRMSRRVAGKELPTEKMDVCTIMPEDLPEVQHPNTEEAIRKMNSLIGLDEVKKQILNHTALVKLNNLRAEKGVFNKMPPMHMVFTGNPGTGKTTIAKYIGEIYHSIGVLSSGHVVVTDRSKLVGEYIGETEKNALSAIRSASGGVLFIDEAYSLVVNDSNNNKRDFGMRVIETLLTYLGSDDTDMIVILAGYTNEMNMMLESNPGMKSRFPYIFHFEDYTPEQLMQIGKQVLEEEHFTITPEAERKLTKYVISEYDHKDDHFGNGRFITRLIKSHIIPSLSDRLLEKSVDDMTLEEMMTIEECDIPDIGSATTKPRELDEAILAESIEKLNGLTGLQNAKKALCDYVTISRLRHEEGTLKITPRTLCWDFIGKTGTGKSTVAKILGKMLTGLGILKRGHTVCVKSDELTGDDSYAVMERVIKEAKDGLLFFDLDEPNLKNVNMNHLRMWTFNKLRELKQTTATVFAQVKAPEDVIAKNLATNGIASYGNYVVFNDFTVAELLSILVTMLKDEYQLEMTPEAEEKVLVYIKNVKASETKETPVNARTIYHLAQTIAHITQLRIAVEKGSHYVTIQDVDHFTWDKRLSGRVGY